jgi:predicted DNA-binding transcriptional regulator YafY
MEASSSRLSRLLNLVAMLSETSTPVSAREIRARVDADYPEDDSLFRRQFERDKKELRELGIELLVEEIGDTDPPELGYRVARDQYGLRLPDLDADEVAALQLAVSLVRLDGIDGGSGLLKLGAGGGGRAGADGLAALPTHPQLGPLFSAVTERRTATFDYREAGASRRVDPYRLDLARGRWYLLGFDHDRDAERWFRLDRIVGSPALGPAHAFEVPTSDVAGSVPDPWLLGDAEPVTARVLVDAAAAPLARSVATNAVVVGDADDGGLVLELPVSHPDGFRSFVLGLGEHAEVLEPAALRADIVSWLESIGDARDG